MSFFAAIQDALNQGLLLGHGLCHQLPARSYDFGGVTWAVCARCSGIYVGLTFALIALLLVYKGKQRHGLMPWYYLLFLAGGLLFMGADGLSSYLYLRETTNLLRWVTGIGMGASLAPIVYFLAINNLAQHSSDQPVLGGTKGGKKSGKKSERVRPWLAIAASMLLAFLMVYPAGSWLGALTAVIAALAIWATYAALALVLLGTRRPFYRSIASWRDGLLPLALAAIIGLALILALAFLYVTILA
ncbi:MAG: DUF2085 domain-containing protein [Coriobacteriia bacterium]|nr:DUF2085 domain-containing protein [Coriobacteriia bacterium]